MLEFIYVLKTIAALFITNSHFDKLYPTAAFSIGGALGNVLFFLVSGFCLSSTVHKSLGQWVGHCMTRIYPALWMISLLLGITNNLVITPDIWIRTFFFPYNSFWFICAILIAYLLAWFVEKYFSSKLYVPAIITALVYFIWYFSCLDLSVWFVEGPTFFKYVFYFGVMLCGMYLRKDLNKIKKNVDGKARLLFMATFASLVTYFVTKILMIKVDWFSYIQFTVQLCTLLFGISCFCWMMSLEPMLKKISTNLLLKLCKLIGNSTLEIYLINYAIIHYAESLSFPNNIILALGLILMIGCILHSVINAITKIVLNRIESK